MAETRKSWLRHEHPEYRRNKKRWQTTRDAYTADLLDSEKISGYLVRKSQGESPEAYNERCQLADYTNHFATLVEELAGMIFAVEAKANRTYSDEDGNGLGQHDDLDTPIGRLYQDADGRGNGWLTVFKQMAIELVHSMKGWVVADATAESPMVRIFPALSVPNWKYDAEGLSDVILKESADVRGSIMDEPGQEDRYVHYHRDGWTRYRITKDESGNESEQVLEEGFWPRGFEDPSGRPALPIFPISLPMPRQVGWIMAKKCIAIFNRESERDNLLRTANFPFLVIPGDEVHFTAQTKGIEKGGRALQSYVGEEGIADPSFIAPDSGPATVATDVLKRKVEEFYYTGFKEYGDAAREKTATEIRHEVAQGVGAFLQLLKAALDDAENGALWRIEQIEFDDRGKWFNSRVERSEDFAIEDPQVLAEKLASRYLGKDQAVPIGKKGVISLVQQLAGYDGLTVSETELEAAVNLHELGAWSKILSTLPVPAEARAEAAVQLLVGLGFIDPDEQIETEGGETRLKVEEMRQKALVIAEAQDQRDRDFLGGVGGFPGIGG